MLAVVALFLISLTTAGTSLYLFLEERNDQPAVAFSAPEYFPVQSIVCPGQTLRYTNALQVLEADDVIVTRSIRQQQAATGRGAVTVATLDQRIFSVEAGDRIRSSRGVVLPYLRPGDYYLLVSAKRLSAPAEPTRYRVHFTVPEGCE